jgi:hypothetical protein
VPAVSIFLVPKHFQYQLFSDASTFLVTAVFWCQRFSGVSPLSVPALFWCQRFSGVSPFSVLALFWCQPYSGASPILGPALFGASIAPVQLFPKPPSPCGHIAIFISSEAKDNSGSRLPKSSVVSSKIQSTNHRRA